MYMEQFTVKHYLHNVSAYIPDDSETQLISFTDS